MLNGSYPALFERAHLVPEQKWNSNALFHQEIELLPAYHSHEKHLLPDFGLLYIYIKQPYQVLIPCDKNLPKKYSSHLKLSYTAVTLRNWAGH